MKKIVIAGALFLSSAMLFAQQTQERTLEAFKEIKSFSIVNVRLIQSDKCGVKIEAEDTSDFDKIVTEVKNGKLEVSVKGNLKGETKVIVSVTQLEGLDVSGASDVKTISPLKVDKLKIESGGAGNVKLELNANEIEVVASGAGNVSLEGTSAKTKITATGAGSVKSFKLVSEHVEVSASGACTVKVNATQSIKASASGASSIQFKGNPKEKSVEASGASTVSNVDENASSDSIDTTRIKIGDTKVIIVDENDDDKEKKEKKEKSSNQNFYCWQGFEIGVNGYLTGQNKIDMIPSYDYLNLNYARSLTFNLNIFEKDIHLYKNYINLVTGLGFEFNHYAFKKSVTLDPDVDYVIGAVDTTMNFNKNKLNLSFVNIPILFSFNTNIKNADRSFHFAFGAIGGYKMKSMTKQHYEINGNQYTIHRKDDYNLNPFRVSAAVRAGYGDFNLFANYALTELFSNNSGPAIYPFSAGLSFNFN